MYTRSCSVWGVAVQGVWHVVAVSVSVREAICILIGVRFGPVNGSQFDEAVLIVSRLSQQLMRTLVSSSAARGADTDGFTPPARQSSTPLYRYTNNRLGSGHASGPGAKRWFAIRDSHIISRDREKTMSSNDPLKDKPQQWLPEALTGNYLGLFRGAWASSTLTFLINYCRSLCVSLITVK